MTLLLGCLFSLALGLLTYLLWVRLRPSARRRSRLLVNPVFRDRLQALGLTDVADFLTLGKVIVSGHLDRNVWSVRLGDGPEAINGFLKREHFVTWTTRLLNALDGFGFVSRSWREMRTLQALTRTRVRCPEWIAAGEDDKGRAFLLLREVSFAIELRDALSHQRDDAGRQRLARRLGSSVARLHAAGFSHPDLHVRHVLIDITGEPVYLDWQRSRPCHQIPDRDRARDLATLHATLADDLASTRERLCFLTAYFRTFEGEKTSEESTSRGLFVLSILKQTHALLQRRHVAEKRKAAPKDVDQAWIPLQHDALCITPRMERLYRERPPHWLARYRKPLPPGPEPARTWLTLPDGRPALLVRRRVFKPMQVQWAAWRRREPVSDDQRTAALLLRLERYNISAPRVLAMGQHGLGKGWLESFVLMEPTPQAIHLETWLKRHEENEAERGEMLREAGSLLHRLHEARCYLTDDAEGRAFAVHQGEGAAPCLVVDRSEAVRFSRKLRPTQAQRDREEMARALAAASCRPEELEQFTRGYFTDDGAESPQGGGSMITPRPTAIPLPPTPPASLWARLSQGTRRLMQDEAWSDLAGSDWADRIMDVEVTDRFHAKQGRSTGRWKLTGPHGRLSVYLKRHYRLPWLHGLMAAIWPRSAWSPAMQEWQHLEWARRQGLAVPRAVAAAEFIGPWGKLQSILAVEELAGMIPLHEAIPLAAKRLPPDVFHRWKRTLIDEMARMTRILHDRACFHKDLYLCHFYIPEADTQGLPVQWRERIHLIDLHRLAHHRLTWRLWQIKDLAQLLYSSEIEGIDARDRLYFWQVYLGPGPHSMIDRWLVRAVRYKWQRYRKHNARLLGSRKNSSETAA